MKFAGHYTVRNPNGGTKITWQMNFIMEVPRGWGLTKINIATAPFTQVR